MKFIGTRPAGTTRTGRRIKELQDRVGTAQLGRSSGAEYRQTSSGTVIATGNAASNAGTATTTVPRWG